jgi:hypothetical protein
VNRRLARRELNAGASAASCGGRLAGMLERLKRLFGTRGTEVEYEPPPAEAPIAVPANPATSGFTPAAPVDRPDADEPDEDR